VSVTKEYGITLAVEEGVIAIAVVNAVIRREALRHM
jgi:hypothetical protein